jgi:diadenosine tetraphosphate (Ap4A) HIT family hydrolase
MHNNAGKVELFSSPAAFRLRFEEGLRRLLEHGGLNLFILVAANASFDKSLHARLRARLGSAYSELLAGLQKVYKQGGSVNEADDDLLVFLKMAAIGFDALALTELRQAGNWEVQFNHLRSFRPMRNSQRPMTSIRAPFDTQGFNFNKPFMQQETLWSGALCGQSFDLYYNKYPFVDQHCLLVPVRQDCLPQYHIEAMHTFVWKLMEMLSPTLPGLRIGYNALGAFASVNHLHFQLFVRDRELPVECENWLHNGGIEPYPVDCRCYEDSRAAWMAIDHLHRNNQAYNLLYTPRGMYCMPRKKQGDFQLAGWSSGFSWYELCGGMITFNRQDFASLQPDQIFTDLSLSRLEEN